MTCLIGAVLGNSVVLIADSSSSRWVEHSHHVNALKIDILSDSVVVAVSGSNFEYQRFKNYLNVVLKEPLSGVAFSERLSRALRNFETRTSSSSLDLLISDRSSGRPVLSRWSSDSNESTVVDTYCVVGSGANVMAPVVREFYQNQRSHVLADVRDRGLPDWATGLVLASLCTRFVRAEGFSQAERENTGGAFYLAYQLADEQGVQPPSLTAIASIQPRVGEVPNIDVTCLRTSFCLGHLVVEDEIAERTYFVTTRELLVDVMKKNGLRTLSAVQDAVLQRSFGMPYYRLLVLVFDQPTVEAFGMHARLRGDEPLLISTPGNGMTDAFSNFLWNTLQLWAQAKTETTGPVSMTDILSLVYPA